MFVSDCLDVNAQGHWTLGGLDTVELAKEFGTPVYIMDEKNERQPRPCQLPSGMIV